MNSFSFNSDILHVENVSLVKISKNVGTPLYVYSKKQFENNYNLLTSSLNKTLGKKYDILIAYSVKSNSNIAVINILNSLNSGADVVSLGELKRSLKSGISGDRIVFSGVGKTSEEMSFALDANILQFNIESIPELKMLSEIASTKGKKAPIAIRINPDINAGGHKNISTGFEGTKFGIDYKEAQEAYDYASNLKGIEIVGVDIHIGSQINDLEPFRLAYEKVSDLVFSLRDKGHNISNIDLGGGIGILYNDSDHIFSLTEYAAMLKQTVGDLGCKIILEPGRLISGNAGVLLTKIIRIKTTNKYNFLLIDAAMNDFLRPALYEANHDIIEVIKSDKNNNKKVYKIAGPICETGDVIKENCYLTNPQEGDLLAILCAGAYGASMSSTYNSRSLIPEVLVSGKKMDIIRKRISTEELISFERIPE